MITTTQEFVQGFFWIDDEAERYVNVRGERFYALILNCYEYSTSL
jgi:hypothetical protein